MNLYAHYYAERLASSFVVHTPQLRRSQFTWGRFPNGELYVRLHAPSREEAAILGSVHPPEERLVAYLLLCDTVKRHGAKYVTAVLPYLGYSRQDKVESGASLAAAWIGQLLQASGVDRVLTLDLHRHTTIELFPIPLSSLPAARVFANAIGTPGENTTLVAPDEGGITRCEELRTSLGLASPLVHCRKVRTAKGAQSELVGRPAREAIVYDDILDTGDTLVACCGRLVDAGVRKILICATHGLFTGSNWRQLWDLNVTRIVCTDSVGDSVPQDERITIVGCASALAAAVQAGAATKDFIRA